MPSVAIRHSMPHHAVPTRPRPWTGRTLVEGACLSHRRAPPRRAAVVGCGREPQGQDDQAATATDTRRPARSRAAIRRTATSNASDSATGKQTVAGHLEDDVGLAVERRYAQASRLPLIEQEAPVETGCARRCPRSRSSHSGWRDAMCGMTAKLYGRRRRGRSPIRVSAVPRVRPGRSAATQPLRRGLTKNNRMPARKGTPRSRRSGWSSRTPSRCGIGLDPTRHAHQPEPVHREEGKVEADEHQPRRPSGRAARPSSGPSSWGTSDRPRRPPAKRLMPISDVMQVGDDEIGVGQLPVEHQACGHHARHAADDEQQDEAW